MIRSDGSVVLTAEEAAIVRSHLKAKDDAIEEAHRAGVLHMAREVEHMRQLVHMQHAGVKVATIGQLVGELAIRLLRLIPFVRLS